MKKKISNFFYRCIIYIVRVLLKVFWNFKVYDKKNIPNPPYIIVSNHLSLLDVFLIGCIYEFRLFYAAKIELFKFPLTRPLIRWLGGIEIDRKDFKKRSWKKLKELIEGKNIIVIFPEGTRNTNPEKGLLPFKAGAALLALEYGLTIVPMGIKGTDKAWARGKFIPKFNQELILRIGKPIKVNKVDKPSKSDIVALNNKIRKEILELIT